MDNVGFRSACVAIWGDFKRLGASAEQNETETGTSYTFRLQALPEPGRLETVTIRLRADQATSSTEVTVEEGNVGDVHPESHAYHVDVLGIARMLAERAHATLTAVMH